MQVIFPLAPGDSSGVQPNIAFDIDGIDYYTNRKPAIPGLVNPGR